MAERETPQTRLKRLAMRSHRRGIREMDLILGAFADAGLADLDDATLDLYERLLDENDHDLYAWIAGRPGAEAEGPAELHPLLDRIAAFARSAPQGEAGR